VDVDEHEGRRNWRPGKPPFYEPGLPELADQGGGVWSVVGSATDVVARSRGSQRALHRSRYAAARRTATPPTSRFVDRGRSPRSCRTCSPVMWWSGKSTVPVGTAERSWSTASVEAVPARDPWRGTPSSCARASPCRTPSRPDRLVYGRRGPDDTTADPSPSSTRCTLAAMANGTPRKVVTNFATAELVKVSANAFLATKISFINAMAEVAEATGADVTALADAIGSRPAHWPPLPERRAGLRRRVPSEGHPRRSWRVRRNSASTRRSRFLREVDSHQLASPRAHRRPREARWSAATSRGKHIAVLGLAFKPDSDDVRDSPALDVAVRLSEFGADVVATDPQARGHRARRRFPGAELRRTHR
jgi:UDPglucose 6-dehydrogenase